MRLKTVTMGWVLALGLMGLAGGAQAALIDRGNGMIYDDVLDVTWLQDANYAKTSGHDTDGLMTWSEATTWAANLVYGGYDDWRLPTVTPVAGGSVFNTSFSLAGTTDYGYNISAPGTTYASSTASELAYMFYNNLGAKAMSTSMAPKMEAMAWSMARVSSPTCKRIGFGLARILLLVPTTPGSSTPATASR
jgi:hypothetical protein